MYLANEIGILHITDLFTMYPQITIVFIAYELSNAQRYLLVEMNDEMKSDNELDVPWTQTKTTFLPGQVQSSLPEQQITPYEGKI